MNKRADSFHAGQIWASPNNNMYRVEKVQLKLATLRRHGTGTTRVVRRPYDAVANWTLIEDKESK